MAESFFATIKKELVHRQPWPTRRDLSAAVFEYIEGFYNRQRRHSTLGYLTPADYEQTTINSNPEKNQTTNPECPPNRGRPPDEKTAASTPADTR